MNLKAPIEKARKTHKEDVYLCTLRQVGMATAILFFGGKNECWFGIVCGYGSQTGALNLVHIKMAVICECTSPRIHETNRLDPIPI